MKKITSIVASFLMLLGMSLQAAPTDLPVLSTEGKPVYHLIKNVRAQKYAHFEGVDHQMTLTTYNSVDAGSLFYFTGTSSEGVANVKIHNKATDSLCASLSSWTTDGAQWYVKALSNRGLSICNQSNFPNDNSSSWNDAGGAGTSVGYWNPTDVGSIWEIVTMEDEIRAILMDMKGKVLFAPEYSQEAEKEILQYLDRVLAGEIEAFSQCMQYVETLATQTPKEGISYVIKSANPLFFEKQGVEMGMTYDGDNLSWNQIQVNNENYHWELTSDNKGNYYLKNKGNGKYFGKLDEREHETLALFADTKEEAIPVNIEKISRYQYKLKPIKDWTRAALHANDHSNGDGGYGKIVLYDGGYNSPSTWTIAEVGNIEIQAEEGYATYYTEKSYVMPEGLTGYTVNNVIVGADNFGTLTYSHIYQGGDIVPAATPLLMKGTKGNYYYAVKPCADNIHFDNWLLSSNDVNNDSQRVYKLSYSYLNGVKTFGFFWGAANGSGNFAKESDKAYLVLHKILHVQGIRLDDLTTGIEGVEAESSVENVIYNLAGVRVNGNLNNLPKGVYVVNGKKVFVK